MARLKKALLGKLLRAYERGASWNWVYWKGVLVQDRQQITLASAPPRVVMDVEAGALSKQQAVQLLASKSGRSLEDFTPFVVLWDQALTLILSMREDARRAALFGQAALDLAREEKWFAAFEACWSAAEIERAYSGRVSRWRPLLYLLVAQLIDSDHERGNDLRVRSVSEAAARATRQGHARRGRG